MRLTCSVPIELANDPRLTKNQIRVIIALLSFKKSKACSIWPSRRALSERCGLPETRISQITGQLEELGWLVKEGKGGYSKTTRYQVRVPKLIPSLKTVTEPVTVDEETVTEPVTGSGYRTCNTQEIINLNSSSSAHARVANNDPETPVSNPPSEKSGAESFAQSPQAWGQYFRQRLGYRPVKPTPEKEHALFERWIAEGVTFEEVEKAIERVERRGAPAPSTPLYYAQIVEEIRREKKNPAAGRPPPPGTHHKHRQASNSVSIQQPSQYAYPADYKPEPRPETDPRVGKCEVARMSAIINNALLSRGIPHELRQ